MIIIIKTFFEIPIILNISNLWFGFEIISLQFKNNPNLKGFGNCTIEMFWQYKLLDFHWEGLLPWRLPSLVLSHIATIICGSFYSPGCPHAYFITLVFKRKPNYIDNQNWLTLISINHANICFTPWFNIHEYTRRGQPLWFQTLSDASPPLGKNQPVWYWPLIISVTFEPVMCRRTDWGYMENVMSMPPPPLTHDAIKGQPLNYDL